MSRYPKRVQDALDSLQIAEFATAPVLARRLGVSRATMYRMTQRDDFPERMSVDGGTSIWRWSEVLDWEVDRGLSSGEYGSLPDDVGRAD